MGDRASVKFKNDNEESVILCAHWGGTDFHDLAKDYTEELISDIKKRERPDFEPLFRMEPSIVMVDFIRWLMRQDYCVSKGRVESSLYLGKERNEVDDSDNGCLVVNLHKIKSKPTRAYEVEG